MRLALDSRGYLRNFEAIPPAPEEIATIRFDRERLFSLIGYNPANFVESAPFRAPLTPFDERHALEGPHPSLPNTRVKVQYATWKGRLTSLYFIFPWSPPILTRVSEPSWAARGMQYFRLVGIVAFFFYSIVIGRRNWVTGRADRKGAYRLGLITMILLAGNWFFSIHFVPDPIMLLFLGDAISNWIFASLIMWQLYLALEPALRARWPKAIITWNRILSGNLLDAQVGSHLLMGVGVGLFIVASYQIRDFFGLSRDGILSFQTGGLFTTREWIAATLGTANGALQSGLVIFFVVFGLRVLLRRDLAAILVASILLTFTNGNLLSSKNPVRDIGIYYLIGLVIMVCLVRFGTLTTVVAVFVANCLLRHSFSSDLTLWFMPYSIATLLMVAALAIFGFWRSLGDQYLVAEAPR